MSNHNQYKRISSTFQANTIVYSDTEGHISDWLNNDPVIQALKQQTEFIGTVATAPAPDTQSILTQFVYDNTSPSRAPRNGDEVAIEDVGELWLFNGTQWVFFTNTTLKDASTTNKGIMQVGSGLSVSSGIVSVDSAIYTPSRTTISNSETTPSIALQTNTDYVFTNALTSLTLTTIPNSSYSITLTFTTGNSFSFSAASLTDYFFSSNPPTFFANRTYKLVIINGKCHIYYTGVGNKITALNGSLTPTDNIATWSISNTLGTSDVIIRVYETSSGNTVEVDSSATASTITVKFYTESQSVSAGTYTLVVIG